MKNNSVGIANNFVSHVIFFLLYVVLHLINVWFNNIEFVWEHGVFLASFLVKDMLSVCLMLLLMKKFAKTEYNTFVGIAIFAGVTAVNISLSILICKLLFGTNSFFWLLAIELSLFFLIIEFGWNYANELAKRKMAEQKALEEEKRDLELYYLGLQLNPHFLFNVLNVIYIQSRKEKAKVSAEMVMQLSDLLRYQLYEGVDKKVMLRSELKYIDNYLELHRMRQMDIDVQYNIEGNLEGVMLYPFMYISLLENAFKYVNVNNLCEKFIKIFIAIDEKYISFAVKNTKATFSEIQNSEKRRSGGLGIANTRKRLELLYPNKYTLKMESDENYFNVELKIEIEND